jgi:hypothetical protein
MPKKEKSLPKPPSTPFARKGHDDEKKSPFLLADRMAMAMAEGRLEEFLIEEMPDNEKARKLAELMMGMTGMLSPGGISQRGKEERGGNAGEPEKPLTQETVGIMPPDDVLEAVKAGDIKDLMGLLRREHVKLTTGEGESPAAEEDTHSAPQKQASISKEVVDHLIEIARDNDLALDWVVLRALKLYAREYQRTGNL